MPAGNTPGLRTLSLNGDTQTLLHIVYLASEGVMGSVFVIFRCFLPSGKGRGRGTELGGKLLEGPGDLELSPGSLRLQLFGDPE